MLKVTTTDGAVFEAQSPGGIVAQMRDAAWRHEDPKQDYMADVSRRVGEAYNEDVRTTPEEFLDDLQRIGLVTVEEVA